MRLEPEFLDARVPGLGRPSGLWPDGVLHDVFMDGWGDLGVERDPVASMSSRSCHEHMVRGVDVEVGGAEDIQGTVPQVDPL